MFIDEFKNEDLSNLKSKLISLYREKLKLVFDRTSSSEFNKTHLIKQNKKNIARILTLISSRKKLI